MGEVLDWAAVGRQRRLAWRAAFETPAERVDSTPVRFYSSPVKRDRARLSAAAGRVEADLRRTTQQPWTCFVADDYTLHVTAGGLSSKVLLEADVEDEEWFAPAEASPADVDDGLDADADELLASEAVELMRVLGITWPVCPDHSQVMGPAQDGGTATANPSTTSPPLDRSKAVTPCLRSRPERSSPGQSHELDDALERLRRIAVHHFGNEGAAGYDDE
jgi:hypothetical protein